MLARIDFECKELNVIVLYYKQLEEYENIIKQCYSYNIMSNDLLNVNMQCNIYDATVYLKIKKMVFVIRLNI